MKNYFFAFFFLTNLTYAFDTSLKGFIALDALNYEKIQDKDGGASIGIAVLDLKVFAEQENLSSAIKLNIDGNLAVQNTIFEEAYASYRGIKDWKFTLGKGVVKFQNLHWGAVENSYLDGGSILGTENSWRKVNGKAFISATYGNRSKGYLDTMSFWGDSSEIQTDEQGKPFYVSSGSSSSKYISAYSMQNVTAFNTSKQLGFGNKLEYFKFDTWTLTAGQVFYKNKLQPEASYGVDFGINQDTDKYELWIDMLYGFTSKAPYEQYTTLAKNEYFIQMGSQYHFDEFWSVIANTEWLFVKDRAHTYSAFNVGSITYNPDSKYTDKSGQLVNSSSFKFESAIQYKLSKSSFITSGACYERKIAEQNGIKDLSYIPGVYNANTEGFKVSSSVSFWF